MSRTLALLDRIAAGNPLLAHGPRSHATGVQLPQPGRPARRRRPRVVDAPRLHLGPAFR